MAVVAVQWAVGWFPSDKPDQMKNFGENETSARRRFEAEQDNGTCPILFSREISDWKPVLNSVDANGVATDA